MKADKYPFARELITETEGNIQKVVIDFNDYQHLLEAIEDEGLILVMRINLYLTQMQIDITVMDCRFCPKYQEQTYPEKHLL
ncbi:hypothetical protein [Scytonema sp. NUACC26]|uniref:hypothetical protein n=1 Tax=Scytonema sp. NUACC26 TaxID=3140176 RepID=UPI0034DC634B